MSRTYTAGTIGEYTTGIDSSATDNDTLAAPQADLEIATTDNLGGSSITSATGTAVSGQGITYTVMVTNAGPSDADGATIADPLPSSLIGATYTATESGGASGFTTSGSGSIDDAAVNLPAGSTVTYTISATVNPAATGTLSNTATVTPPAGVTDTNSPGATVNAALVTGLNNSGFYNPLGIAVSGGDLFVTNWYSGTIGEYTTSGAVVNASLVSGLDDPGAIAVSGGDLFVSRMARLANTTPSRGC